jgi:DNA-binding NarL/FixJ family response regulator
MQCQGHRGNGEPFTAEVWFSTYKEGSRPKLAAIIADVTEETPPADPNSSHPESEERAALTDRELDVLRCLVQGLANRAIATRMEASESAVKHALHLIFTKTKVHTRGQLVRVALERYRDLL